MNRTDTSYKTVSLKPFKYLKPSVRTEAYVFIILLAMQIAMLVATKSFSSLFVILSAVFASFTADFIDMMKMRRTNKIEHKDLFTWGRTLIIGVIIGLLLPSSYPLLAVFFITFFVQILNRYILGGFANSWINPVAITVAVCWIIGMKFFPSVNVTVTELQNKNPALTLIHNGTFPIAGFDARITSFLNKKVFSMFGVSIPDGYVSILWDSGSTIPAFRFNFLTIISSIILLSLDIINPIIPAMYLFTYMILVKFLMPFFYNGALFQGDIILAALTSGTLFCTFFILQWHGTVPYTNRGKVVYGFLAGLFAFFIVGCGTSPSGTIFTILIINIFSLLIQSYENKISERYAQTVLKRKIKSVKEGNHA